MVILILNLRIIEGTLICKEQDLDHEQPLQNGRGFRRSHMTEMSDVFHYEPDHQRTFVHTNICLYFCPKILLLKWLCILFCKVFCHRKHVTPECLECLDLTLKTPRKPASENVVCLCRLLNILKTFGTYFCIQANSVDLDQTAPRGAV